MATQYQRVKNAGVVALLFFSFLCSLQFWFGWTERTRSLRRRGGREVTNQKSVSSSSSSSSSLEPGELSSREEENDLSDKAKVEKSSIPSLEQNSLQLVENEVSNLSDATSKQTLTLDSIVVVGKESASSSEPEPEPVMLPDDVQEKEEEKMFIPPPLEKEGRPSLVIHIGPSKTGSTTIQKDCANLTDPLALDNYVYLGSKSKQERMSKFHTKLLKKPPEGPSWKEWWNTTGVVKELEERFQRNQSIIMSDEAYSFTNLFAQHDTPEFFEAFSELTKNWNVLVVGVYRRYAEWALSAIKQGHAMSCLDKRRKKACNWPHLGGIPCGNNWRPVNNWIRWKRTGVRFFNFIDVTLSAWKNAGFNTVVLNFHSKHHLTTSFFCDSLKYTAPNTCQHLRQLPSRRKENSRSVVSSAYSNIVFVAAEKGIVDLNQTRFGAATALENYHATKLGLSFPDLPLDCPKQHELLKLLNHSLGLERNILPTLYRSPDGEATHREAFSYLAHDLKQFCSVKVDQLLQNVSSWEELLQRMNNTHWR